MKFFTSHHDYWHLNAAVAGLLIGGWGALLAVAILTSSVPAMIAMIALSPVFIAFYELMHWYLDTNAYQLIEKELTALYPGEGDEAKINEALQWLFKQKGTPFFKAARAQKFKQDLEFFLDGSSNTIGFSDEQYLQLATFFHIQKQSTEMQRASVGVGLPAFSFLGIGGYVCTLLLTPEPVSSILVGAVGLFGFIFLVGFPVAFTLAYFGGRVAYSLGVGHSNDSTLPTHVDQRLLAMLGGVCDKHQKCLSDGSKQKLLLVLAGALFKDEKNPIKVLRQGDSKDIDSPKRAAEKLHQTLLQMMNDEVMDHSTEGVVSQLYRTDGEGIELQDVGDLPGNRLVLENEETVPLVP